MFLHAHEIEAVAERAAALYGQTWESIPQHSKQIWLQTVQGASPDSEGVTDAEKAACAALREWVNPVKPVLPPIFGQGIEEMVAQSAPPSAPEAETPKTAGKPVKPKK